MRTNFDAAENDLLTALDGQPAKTAFFHPPYLDMISYSGNQWGAQADKRDLSHMDDKTFFEFLQAVLQNIARAIAPGGTYGVLVGNRRQKGKAFVRMSTYVEALAPDPLVMEIIKAQHNTKSSRTAYSGAFVPTLHETFLVFTRQDDKTSFIMGLNTLARIGKLVDMTWANVIRSALRAGEIVSPLEIIHKIEQHPKTAGNKNIDAKIRQVLRKHPEHFRQVARGRYVARDSVQQAALASAFA
ncbi:MAG: DNA adenine modification methylase [Vulcanimicrobiaceae bacterium]